MVEPTARRIRIGGRGAALGALAAALAAAVGLEVGALARADEAPAGEAAPAREEALAAAPVAEPGYAMPGATPVAEPGSATPGAAPVATPAEPGPAPPPADWRELAPGLRLGGSVRLRYEHREDFTLEGGDLDDLLLTQVRVHLTYTPNEWVKLFVEGQYADIQGEQDFDPEAVPSIFVDRFDLHQGYLELAAPLEVPLRLRVGRQKLAFGRERLVSPLEWVNTARVFDAARLTVGDDATRSADLFAARLVGVDPDDPNDWGPTRNRHYDSAFMGVHLREAALLPAVKLELYALVRYADRHDDAVVTLGGRVEGALGPFDLEVEGAWQGGRFGDLTHRAHMVHGEIGVTFPLPLVDRARVAVIGNWGSGDPDPDDSVHQTFDNLYPLNHAYYGFIDFFALQNLFEAAGEAKVWIAKGVIARAAFHLFWLDEEESDAWYHAGLGVKRPRAGRPVPSYVGSELDLTLGVKLWNDRLDILLGYSHFFAGSYAKATGPADDADFVYVQVGLRW